MGEDALFRKEGGPCWQEEQPSKEQQQPARGEKTCIMTTRTLWWRVAWQVRTTLTTKLLDVPIMDHANHHEWLSDVFKPKPVHSLHSLIACSSHITWCCFLLPTFARWWGLWMTGREPCLSYGLVLHTSPLRAPLQDHFTTQDNSATLASMIRLGYARPLRTACWWLRLPNASLPSVGGGAHSQRHIDRGTSSAPEQEDAMQEWRISDELPLSHGWAYRRMRGHSVPTRLCILQAVLGISAVRC